jgi:Mn-containing catalase
MCQPASRWAAWVRRQPKDPKLHATYDGKQGKPSGPALGTESGLAGKIKDALT